MKIRRMEKQNKRVNKMNKINKYKAGKILDALQLGFFTMVFGIGIFFCLIKNSPIYYVQITGYVYGVSVMLHYALRYQYEPYRRI